MCFGSHISGGARGAQPPLPMFEPLLAKFLKDAFFSRYKNILVIAMKRFNTYVILWSSYVFWKKIKYSKYNFQSGSRGYNLPLKT